VARPRAKGKGSRLLNELPSDLGAAFGIPTTEEGRRTHIRLHQPVRESNEDEEYALATAYMSHTIDYHDGIVEPRSYVEAVKSPQADEWKKAMLHELDAIYKQEAFEEIAHLPDPENKKAIGSHWVFKVKRDSEGKVIRYKARVVARGDQQREGIDYAETYAPTARMGHLRLALALAGKYGWEIQQMDVCTAFLGSVLRKDIYMHPTPGYAQLLQLAPRVGEHKPVWKLLHSLYRLKQSPYEWYHTLRQYLESLSLCLSRLDGGFFIFTNMKLDIRIILSIHVDDILLIGTHMLIALLKEEMKECFEMHDLGEASLYLGMSIEREQEKRSILLSQSHYVQTVLDRFKMHEANPVSTPMDPKIRLVKRSDNDEPCDKALVTGGSGQGSR